MSRFEIRESFYLDGEEFKILSGAIHYFRLDPSDWYASLYNLKALGFNTVETYLPWNLHEEKKGLFDFEGRLDIEAFLKMAQSLGLYAILRPSPYICAEWEFGGLPAWLLKERMRIRSSDPAFIEAVASYYDVLLPRLAPFQLDRGGNILMMQVENEYGSFGEDKAYLRAIRDLMLERDITCPLFTSDGPWLATLKAGSLIEDGIFTTGNFGSRANENFDSMEAFFQSHGRKWPLMCMEFWDGWFNRWKEPIIKRDAEDLAEAVKECLDRGSINLYMFHGGSNFGFMNGCSARGSRDLPQVTSYDYDALLDEAGNPQEKYFAVKRMMAQFFPQYPQMDPIIKDHSPSYQIELADKVSLFEVKDLLARPVESLYPQSMKELDQAYGYVLYETEAVWDATEERVRIIDARDRVQVYQDGQYIETQYQDEIGQDISLPGHLGQSYQLSFLVENMGRVNYGHKLLTDTQDKGIRQGVMKDLHFMTKWKSYSLDLKDLSGLDFSRPWQPKQAAFYRFSFSVQQPSYNTYINLENFGKGVAFINGHNLGRFWQVGPTLSLYIPKGFLKEGENELIIFETEGIYSDTIEVSHQAAFKPLKGDNL